ncbi:MAG: glycosyltransferase, partial [Acidobacteriota bacterium]
MSKPRVSVLLPVYNAVEFLPVCLKSLERQTLKDFEVVAVDDGSSDGSSEILKDWGRRDQRFRVVERSHQGLVPSLNYGLGECRGDLVARMDADDIAHPARLQSQVELMESRPELSVVSCLVRHFPVHRVAQGFKLYDEWLNSLIDHEQMARERFVESPVAHPSVLFRLKAVAEVGGYRDWGWPEDYDLWLRLFERGSLFAKVPRILFFWREGACRLSRSDPRYSPDAFLRCRAHFFARGPGAEGRSVIIWGAGPNGKRLHR